MTMRNKLKLVGPLLFIISLPILADSLPTLSQCASVTDAQQRLQCYDQVAAETRTQSVQGSLPSSSTMDPAGQDMLPTLQQAWGNQISEVVTENGILQVHTTFLKVNQIAYEVMLATMCGQIAKNNKLYSNVKSIAILNRAENQGFLFVAPYECEQIAFKPVDQTRLIILGNTRNFNT